jgi:hypothetical protein
MVLYLALASTHTILKNLYTVQLCPVTVLYLALASTHTILQPCALFS